MSVRFQIVTHVDSIAVFDTGPFGMGPSRNTFISYSTRLFNYFVRLVTISEHCCIIAFYCPLCAKVSSCMKFKTFIASNCDIKSFALFCEFGCFHCRKLVQLILKFRVVWENNFLESLFRRNRERWQSERVNLIIYCKHEWIFYLSCLEMRLFGFTR